MRRFGSLPFVPVLVLAALAICMLGARLNHYRYSGDVIEELTYFPSGRLLHLADLGYDALVADLMWLKGVQYYGEHRKTDREYPLAEHVFSTITSLDPGFIGAYRFGAFVLAEDVGTPAGAVDLLRKGMRNNPERWEIPFDLGFLYFVVLDDNPKAAHYFRLASGFPNSPDITKRFTAFAYRKSGRVDLARALWEEIYRSSQNKMMRESAAFALKRIDLDDASELLGGLVGRFQDLTGRSPYNLEEIVRAGLMGEIPRDPFGGRYFLDPQTEKVLSTSRVATEAEGMKRYVERSIRRYRDMKGHLPQSLAELKTEGLIDEIPIVAGTEVRYDPVTGTVEYDLVWREARQ